MTFYRTLLRWLRAPIHDPVKIPARARFDADEKLEDRIDDARKALVRDGKHVDRARV